MVNFSTPKKGIRKKKIDHIIERRKTNLCNNLDELFKLPLDVILNLIIFFTYLNHFAEV
jgi:hypothetical protein